MADMHANEDRFLHKNTRGVGYVGPTLTSIVSGWLIDNYSWDATFSSWIASAFIAAGLIAVLWRFKSPREKYF